MPLQSIVVRTYFSFLGNAPAQVQRTLCQSFISPKVEGLSTLTSTLSATGSKSNVRNLLNVLDFLKRPNASELVSGTADRVNLHDKFRASIEAAFPGTIDQLAAIAKEKMARSKKLNFWESTTDACTGGFRSRIGDLGEFYPFRY